MARKVFDMIDVDNSGTLQKAEIIESVSEQSNPVVLFLINCGNQNLQHRRPRRSLPSRTTRLL